MAEVRSKLLIVGKKEIKMKWEKLYAKESLPFSRTNVSRIDVFYNMNLTIIDQPDIVESVISCKDIFDKLPGSTNVTNVNIIEGDAGSGKTTFLRKIVQDFLQIKELAEIFKGVRKYESLIFIECRNASIKSFEQLMSQSFPETLEEDEVSDALIELRDMKVLILIDGLDELTTQSRLLVDEVLEHFRGNNTAMFVITSRPEESLNFRYKLDSEQLNYHVFGIENITNEEEQVEFLRQYQEVIPGIQFSELVDTLNSVRDISPHFTHPVYLSLFCHLFKRYPDDVKEWTNEWTLMAHIVKLCETEMMIRLKDFDTTENIVNDIFDATCDLSLRCVYEDKDSLDQRTYEQFRQDCDSIREDLPYDSILSCIFRVRASFNFPEEIVCKFYHKSVQEFFAAKSITRRLSKHPGTSVLDVLKDIVGDEVNDAGLRRLQNVVKFVAIELTQPNNPTTTLKRQLGELVIVLQRGSADYHYWLELVACCPNSDYLAQVAGPAAATAIVDWRAPVDSPREAEALARILPYGDYHGISVHARALPSPELSKLLATAVVYNAGDLWLYLYHSHDTCVPCDDTVNLLSGMRGVLTGFVGCVASSEAVRAMAGVVSQESMLDLALSSEQALGHSLLELPAVARLCVTVQQGPCTTAQQQRPLPQGCQLTVDGISDGAVTHVVQTIRALVPQDNRYHTLQLRRCCLSDAELGRLLAALHAGGVRAGRQDGDSCWALISTGGDMCGVCCDMCRSTGADERCVKMCLSDTAPE